MIEIREATPADRNFVLSTWVECEEEHTRLPGGRDETFTSLRAKAGRLFARSRVLVAAPEGDPITVLAWLAVDAEKACVHYAYTRRALRRQGIQRDLATRAGLSRKMIATCKTPKQPLPGVHHDPMLGWSLAVRDHA